jgi:hypothetical protein
MKNTDDMAQYEEILDFFKNLHLSNFTGHDDFMFTVVPEFAKFLGYDEDDLFYDVNIGRKKPLIADVVIKQGVESEPDIVVEIKFPGNVLGTYLRNHAKNLSNQSGVNSIVLISPVVIIVFSKGEFYLYPLESIDVKSLKEINTMLRTKHGNKRHAAAY